MYRLEHRHQLSFEDFFLPFGGKLSGDNRWIKLADLIRSEVLSYCRAKKQIDAQYRIAGKRPQSRPAVRQQSWS
jgi:hypothetical protein